MRTLNNHSKYERKLRALNERKTRYRFQKQEYDGKYMSLQRKVLKEIRFHLKFVINNRYMFQSDIASKEGKIMTTVTKKSIYFKGGSQIRLKHAKMEDLILILSFLEV